MIQVPHDIIQQYLYFFFSTFSVYINRWSSLCKGILQKVPQQRLKLRPSEKPVLAANLARLYLEAIDGGFYEVRIPFLPQRHGEHGGILRLLKIIYSVNLCALRVSVVKRNIYFILSAVTTMRHFQFMRFRLPPNSNRLFTNFG